MFSSVATTRRIITGRVWDLFPRLYNSVAERGMSGVTKPVVGHDKQKSEFYVRLQGEALA